MLLKPKTSSLIVLIAGACLLLAGQTIPATAQERIAVGIAVPLTGVYAPLGRQIIEGARFAADEINQAGGIKGTDLTIEPIDDACDPAKASGIANQMVGRNVVAVIGHLCDRPSIESAAVYAENEIVQISPASQNPAFTDNRPREDGGTYRLAARNTQQGDTITEFVLGMDEPKIAVIHDGSVYGKRLADLLTRELDEAGRPAVLAESFVTGEESYRRLAARLVDSGADTVFIGGFHTDAAIIIRDVDRLKTDMTFIGGDGLVHADFPSGVLENNAARRELSGIFVSFPPDPRRFPWARDTVQALLDAGKSANGLTLRGHAALTIIADALKTDPDGGYEGLIAALNSSTFDTVLGPIRFNEQGDANLIDYLMHEWQGATIVPVAPQDTEPSDLSAEPADETPPPGE